MGRFVNQVKKFSEFCATGLEDYYYYKFLFRKIQKNLIKENPYVKNLEFEKKVKRYYASHGFKIDPMWHSFYAYNNGIEDVRYIPDNLFSGKIEPYFNKKLFAKAIDDKNYYDLRLDTSIVHIPYIYVRNIEGYFYDHNFKLIDEKEAVRICREIKNAFVIKPSIDGKGGAEVKFVEVLKEDEKSFKNLFRDYTKDFVVQEIFCQNGPLHEINPTSVNTLRFMTFHTGKEIVLLSAVLRTGGIGARVDNAHSGGIFCGIDKNGCTKDVAWNQSFKKFQKHPNGNDFKHIKVPNYNGIIEMLKKQHMRLGHFRILSWDVAVSEDDVAIIEFNIVPQAIDLHQMCNGPLFGKYTDQVLREMNLTKRLKRS